MRQALGEAEFNSLRYYESAAEVVRNEEDEKVCKKFHRFVLLTEATLFVLDVSKKEASRNIWKGEGAHEPIGLQHVISVQPLTKRSEIFAEDDRNKTVRHFEVAYQQLDKNRRPQWHQLELAAWEPGSLLLSQISSAWMNLMIRRSLHIDISTHLEESKSLMFDLYQEISEDIMRHAVEEPDRLLESVGELASAALQDRELKRLFFTMPALMHHLLGELEVNRVPPNAQDTMIRSRGQRAQQGPVFESRSSQLEYVHAILHLFHCMIFNSQTVLERSNLLTPSPLRFADLLEVLSIQYDDAAVERELARREAQRRRCENLGADGDTEGDDEDEFAVDGGELDDLGEDPYALTLESAGALELDTLVESVRRGIGSPHKMVRHQRRPEGGADATSRELLSMIGECQVAILLEMEDFIALAIAQGRSRAVVSETLAHQLSKTGPEFNRFALMRIVNRLVHLIDAWGLLASTESDTKKGKSMDWGSLAVRIYHHCKLLHTLILGSYEMLEHILDNNEEELRYYLFKDQFVGKLANLPMRASRETVVQIGILHRCSRDAIEEIREAILDLQMQRAKEVKGQSVLLV
ncbi:Uncharacterized protein SCF082_LOCUS3998 [Durusdinium trenchii]|uniref:Exocyst complex component Sec8 n=1 Tax=Durusdinium trenchii TaxID=1381693 RepID=A0ABP0HY88_9DINO